MNLFNRFTVLRAKQIVFVFLFTATLVCHSQNVDSLKALLKTNLTDTARCNVLCRLVDLETDDNVWKVYNQQVYDIASKNLKNKTGIKTSIDTFFNVQLANAYSNFGLLAHNKGDFSVALQNYNKALDRENITKNKMNLALIYNNIAGVYLEQRQFKTAIEFFSKSLELRLLIKDWDGIEQCYSNMGSTYSEQHDTANTRICYFKALEISEKINSPERAGLTYNNLGYFFREAGNYQKAMEFFTKSLAIQDQIHNKRGKCAVLGNIAVTLRGQKKYKEAKEYATKAMTLAKEIGYPIHIKSQALALYEIEKDLGNWKEALTNYRVYIKMRDSLLSMDNAKATMKQQMQNDYEKQKAVDQAVHEQELVLSEEREQRQKVVSVAVGVGLVLVLIFAVFIFNRLRVTNRQKKIIEEQKHLVEEKSSIIEEKQKEIIDSINYARRIQHTLLAHEDYLNEHLPNHFVFFQPKDIVSGDFYWSTSVTGSEQITNNKEHENVELFYLAVCDSTGHGVPGAFMSLLNISFLNEAINEKKIYEPHLILNHVRKRLIEELSKEGAQDGMDAILICIEKYRVAGKQKINKITYAAANNSPLLISGDSFVELEKDKMPVGKGERNDSFVLRTIDAKPGDSIYLYTDGFADQFGGPKGKKFKYKALNKLLLEHNSTDLTEQRKLLETNFESWRGNLEQVDDVCIIGIRV